MFSGVGYARDYQTEVPARSFFCWVEVCKQTGELVGVLPEWLGVLLGNAAGYVCGAFSLFGFEAEYDLDENPQCGGMGFYLTGDFSCTGKGPSALT